MRFWIRQLLGKKFPPGDERPLHRVPAPLILTMLLALLAHGWLHRHQPEPRALASELYLAPTYNSLQLLSLGDTTSLARLLLLGLQAVDFQSGSKTSYRTLDYAVLEQWLGNLLDLDPYSQYPLMLASRVYAETSDSMKQRRMLRFVRQRFDQDPTRRWPWLAHAVIIAKHRLHDLELAADYAEALESLAGTPGIPAWVWQMRVFILEDMNELQAAQVLLGGLLSRNTVHDPAELRFLEQRLAELQRREVNNGQSFVDTNRPEPTIHRH
jgi:hypothetical protein